jgi:hypothetical protein
LTLPEPEPDAPFVIVIHDAELEAVQLHPDAEVTETLPVPELFGAFALVGVTEKLQGTPAWDTVNVCPAIVSVPVRFDVEVFAATV